MTEFDLALLQPLLTQLAPEGRTNLIPALWAAQEQYGYIPEIVAREIAFALKVPLADVFGVIDFYALLYDRPVGEMLIHVCNDPVCAMAGAETVRKKVSAELSEDGRTYTIERAPCLGLCEHAPSLLVQGIPAFKTSANSWRDLLSAEMQHPQESVYGELDFLTSNCRAGKPTDIAMYLISGGYQGLQKALEKSPREVIEEIKTSGLVGRGGAAFPTGIKWEATANASDKIRYVVCNGDEAEPSTFKDRILMENDPHRIIEGLIIAGFAVGAQKGYFYVRGEYRYSYDVVENALAEAERAGYLGNQILGSDYSFEIEMRRGVGAYICGEETALFECIEGKRGLSRVKPPYPATYGLFGKPTAINNVETLVNIPVILTMGAQTYSQIGSEKAPGPKLFCVSGDVEKPGLYEVPMGITLRHLLVDLAGGVRGGKGLKAVLLGGAAGVFATKDHLDVPLTFHDLRAAGLALGSGVVTVFNDQRDMSEIMLLLTHFFADESCGKCYPCQLGTQRQYEILGRVARDEVLEGDRERLRDLADTMRESSICGLGQTAGSAVLSGLAYWPELFLSSEERMEKS
ncbi:MAG: NAD(P)H-dependent oxidoreductase subunit E [Anaerolineaceae bacterium]|nr:NAD(P)H-dependent oxidoreductase subunit E [Anaerolineaceae bacterium]